ncbi:HAD family hydrolase [Streptomyces rhizosphaerihabitans]|uniref:HAD family hydrolase n=1 Tax=Streptomyces rhizosphaerihabitans TaxID=1266770 RepID=UPI0021BFAE82|nr:HAD family hydrolase [Streptomyces rhizosphaerihabitans]MCT9003626.1 HAD family hydrolase [Streptomyces rhizosphaerihabitans]
MFDFDGPVCRLFPEGSSMRVADTVRGLVTNLGLADALTEEERADKDPHVVLRAVHRVLWESDPKDLGVEAPDPAALVGELDKCVTRGEWEAALTAWPTPDADALIARLAGRRLRLAVVTNNAPRAADRYLRNHHLRGFFEAVHGRSADPDLMKPHPDVLHRALAGMGLQPEDAVMIGDTPTDFVAAERAGVRFIGYGRNPEKRARLRDAGAKIVIGSYAPLLEEARGGGADGPAGRVTGEAKGVATSR